MLSHVPTFAESAINSPVEDISVPQLSMPATPPGPYFRLQGNQLAGSSSHWTMEFFSQPLLST